MNRFAGFWTVVYLCEVEDVRLVVQDKPRATFVIPIHIIDAVTFNQEELGVLKAT